MLIPYKSFKFKQATLDIIEKANEIIDDFEGQGYTLSLRQLYYQFVAKALIENTERSYKNLGSIITDARLAGMVSWTAIEDRNRTSAEGIDANEDEREAVRGIEAFIRLDFWRRQKKYIEVWVEKDALLSVVERTCQRYKVPYMACKGYLSASEAWRAGQRFQEKAGDGDECHLLHLGDHDPSGLDMTRDNDDRLQLFAGVDVEVHRLALNMDQVQKYDPPPNPAKITDSRAVEYIKKHGRESWELDALSPATIDGIIAKKIKSFIDADVWEATQDEQEEKRKLVASIHDNWDEVKPFLQGL